MKSTKNKQTARQKKTPEADCKLDDAVVEAAMSDPIFRAAFDHLNGVWDRAKADVREDKDIERMLIRHMWTDGGTIIDLVWNYIHLAQGLRRQVLEQLAKPQGLPQQGQLFE
jgi:hypothetical protein